MLSIEGIIVNNEGEARKRIEIDTASGRISKISEPTGSADIVLGNELIFPGFIDIHVHAREDSTHREDYKEDFVTAGEAAIHGGVVAFGNMPNSPKPPKDDESYAASVFLEKKSPVPIVQIAGVGPKTNPLSKKVPYKIFMGHSIGDIFFSSYEELENTVKRYAGQTISFHCEDPKILERSKDKGTHSERRPASAEISAVDFAIHLIQKYDLTGNICHVSTMEAVEKIVMAKSLGLKITAEATPHHLYFDEAKMMGEDAERFQVNPPIRQSRENRLGLISALKAGDIDFLATDHAPHTIEEKKRGMSGMPHLDTYGPFAAWLMKEHGFTPQNILQACANGPGKFFEAFLPDRYGRVEEGYAGSLTVLDMNTPITIRAEDLKTKCKWSPFEGVQFPGRVALTIVKGKVYGKY